MFHGEPVELYPDGLPEALKLSSWLELLTRRGAIGGAGPAASFRPRNSEPIFGLKGVQLQVAPAIWEK